MSVNPYQNETLFQSSRLPQTNFASILGYYHLIDLGMIEYTTTTPDGLFARISCYSIASDTQIILEGVEVLTIGAAAAGLGTNYRGSYGLVFCVNQGPTGALSDEFQPLQSAYTKYCCIPVNTPCTQLTSLFFGEDGQTRLNSKYCRVELEPLGALQVVQGTDRTLRWDIDGSFTVEAGNYQESIDRDNLRYKVRWGADWKRVAFYERTDATGLCIRLRNTTQDFEYDYAPTAPKLWEQLEAFEGWRYKEEIDPAANITRIWYDDNFKVVRVERFAAGGAADQLWQTADGNKLRQTVVQPTGTLTDTMYDGSDGTTVLYQNTVAADGTSVLKYKGMVLEGIEGSKLSIKNGQKNLKAILDKFADDLQSALLDTTPTTMGSPGSQTFNPAIVTSVQSAVSTAKTDWGALLA